MYNAKDTAISVLDKNNSLGICVERTVLFVQV